MLFDFLGFDQAAEEGYLLGAWFLEFALLQFASRPAESASVYDGFTRYFNHRIHQLRLNILSKARLFIALKRTLIERGFSGDDLKYLTRHLMISLYRSRKTTQGTSPPPLQPAENRAFLEAHESYKKGEYSKAASLYKKLAARIPESSMAYANLAATEILLGRFQEAEKHLRTAIWLDPDCADTYADLGSVLEILGQVNQAESILHMALRIDPVHREAHLNLGRVYMQINRFAEADKLLRSILGESPDDLEALTLLGSLLKNEGRYDEADRCFRRVLELQPRNVIAHCCLVDLRKMMPVDREWLVTAEYLLRGNLSLSEERALRFAMGKYCDDVGKCDAAFGHFRRANELRKKVSPKYDHQKNTAFVDSVIKNYDSEYVTTTAGWGNKSDRPIFVVGLPRSGTSLVEQIIASHPDAFGAGELLFWNDVRQMHDAQKRHPMCNKRDILELSRSYLKLLSERSSGAAKVVDKAPMNYLSLALIHATFPGARIIHMTRHPVDTCLSIHFQNLSSSYYFASTLQDLKHFYEQYRRLMKHWHQVLPSGVILDVPYEALVAETEQWSRKILDHVGLSWNDRCLRFNETRRRVGTASHWQVRQKIYQSSVERWRNYEKHVAPLLPLLREG